MRSWPQPARDHGLRSGRCQRGAFRIRTGVRGFAGRCLTTRPRRRTRPQGDESGTLLTGHREGEVRGTLTLPGDDVVEVPVLRLAGDGALRRASTSSSRSTSNGCEQPLELVAVDGRRSPSPPTGRARPKSWPQKRPSGRSDSTIRAPERVERRRRAEGEREARVDEVAGGPAAPPRSGPSLVSSRRESAPSERRAGDRSPPARDRSRSRSSRGAGARRCRARAPAPRSTARPGAAKRSSASRSVGARVVAGEPQVAAPGMPGLLEHAQPVAVAELRRAPPRRSRAAASAATRAGQPGRCRRARRGPSAPSKSEPNPTWSTPMRETM